MASPRSRRPFRAPLPTALITTLVVASFAAGCVDGTTPNCSGEAASSCGPGFEAGDGSYEATTAEGGTDATVDGGADAEGDATVNDAAADGGDASQPADASIDAPGDAPADSGPVGDGTAADSSSKG